MADTAAHVITEVPAVVLESHNGLQYSVIRPRDNTSRHVLGAVTMQPQHVQAVRCCAGVEVKFCEVARDESDKLKSDYLLDCSSFTKLTKSAVPLINLTVCCSTFRN